MEVKEPNVWSENKNDKYAMTTHACSRNARILAVYTYIFAICAQQTRCLRRFFFPFVCAMLSHVANCAMTYSRVR